VYSFRVHKNVW